MVHIIFSTWIIFFILYYFNKVKKRKANCESDYRQNKLDQRIVLGGVIFGVVLYIIILIAVYLIY